MWRSGDTPRWSPHTRTSSVLGLGVISSDFPSLLVFQWRDSPILMLPPTSQPLGTITASPTIAFSNTMVTQRRSSQAETPVFDAASPTLAEDLHERRPGKRPAARGTAFYPRKRANTACQVCRARKTKCDNKKPSCSYCLSVGATCIQSAVDLSSFDPASLKILDRLDDLERLFRESKSNTEPQEPAYPHPTPANVVAGGSGPSLEDHRLSDHLDTPLRSVLPERVEHVLQWPGFSDGQLPLEPPSAASPSSVTTTPTPSFGSLAELAEIEPTRLNLLLDNFFMYVHCKNPILDELSTRRVVKRAFLDGIDWSPASCLSLIICALGCVSGPFGPSHDMAPGSRAYTDSQIFFQAAQKRIGTLLSSPDIAGAQCLFLSGVYMMTVFQPVFAWRFFSQALAACQHFPFLTKAQHMSSAVDFSADSMEMGRRDTNEQAVYWSAWKSERELRMELSLPDFNILNSGSTLYPPFFPAPPGPSEQNSPGSATDPPEQRARAAWLFYLAEISLRRLNSRLCSEILTLRQEYTSTQRFLEVLAEMIPEYETQAREWAANLPAELSIPNDPQEDKICGSVIRCHLANLDELIYWACCIAGLEARAAGRSLSPMVQEMAYRGLETHVNRLRVNEPGFLHRHHGTLFMIKSCTRSALVLVASANAGITMPPDWHGAVYKAIGLLGYWSGELSDLGQWQATIERQMSNVMQS